MAELEHDTPAAIQAQWVFQVLGRIHAGEAIPHDEVIRHFAPQILKAYSPEQILAGYRDAAQGAAQIATHTDGGRSRWWFIVERHAAHRILAQMWTGPLPAYTD